MANKPNHDLALARTYLWIAVAKLLDTALSLLGTVINYPSYEKQMAFQVRVKSWNLGVRPYR